MTSKKSSALKKLEEKRSASRPLIDASALVGKRPRPISRPPGEVKSETEVEEEARSLMKQLISPSTAQAQPAAGEERGPYTQPDPDTVADSNTVSISVAVPSSVTVSDSEAVVSPDTVSPSGGPVEEVTQPLHLLRPARASARPQRIARTQPAFPDISDLLTQHGNQKVRPQGGYTAVPWAIDDFLAQRQTPLEQAVYRQLFRLAYGFGNTHCFIGYDGLVKRCNSSKSALRTALKGLEQKQHIETMATFNERVIKGTVYRIFLPSEIKEIAALLPASSKDLSAGPGERGLIADTPSLSNTVVFNTTVSESATGSPGDTDTGSGTVSNSHTVQELTVSSGITVSESETIKNDRSGFHEETKTPELDPHAVPGASGSTKSPHEGEPRVAASRKKQKPPSASVPVLSEMDEAYIRSQPSPRQVDLFEAQDAWDEILGPQNRPAASKLGEMLGYIRERGYSGDNLKEKFRGCLEKTKGKAKDPVGWIVSALKAGRYP